MEPLTDQEREMLLEMFPDETDAWMWPYQSFKANAKLIWEQDEKDDLMRVGPVMFCKNNKMNYRNRELQAAKVKWNEIKGADPSYESFKVGNRILYRAKRRR